jgi:hypothetical protein
MRFPASLSRCTGRPRILNAAARRIGLTRLLLRGTQKVRTVLLWFALAHNMLRAFALRRAAAAAGGTSRQARLLNDHQPPRASLPPASFTAVANRTSLPTHAVTELLSDRHGRPDKGAQALGMTEATNAIKGLRYSEFPTGPRPTRPVRKPQQIRDELWRESVPFSCQEGLPFETPPVAAPQDKGASRTTHSIGAAPIPARDRFLRAHTKPGPTRPSLVRPKSGSQLSPGKRLCGVIQGASAAGQW